MKGDVTKPTLRKAVPTSCHGYYSIEQQLQTDQGLRAGCPLFHFVMCCMYFFIDETALGLGWDQDNGWVKQSLLVHFHNESLG